MQTPLNIDLPDDLDAYFLSPAGYFDLGLDLLEPTRARPVGIANAAFYMDQARRGLKDKREPIDIRKTEEGTWQIVDGNSTFAVAKAAGWAKIRCMEKTS